MKLFVQSPGGTKRPLLIDERAPLGGGGEGKIYADANDTGVAIKVFSQVDRTRKAKIEAMLARSPSTTSIAQLAWPQALVIDGLGVLHGLAMPRIDTAQYFTLDALLIASARQKQKLRGDSATDYRFRVTVARNLAKAVAQVHEAGHALVDIKPLNMFVHRTTGAIAIVDCDGCRIVGAKQTFPAAVATEEYLAPEFHGKVESADARQDLFALAMVIFRLLNNDLFPMNGVPHDPAAPTSHVQRIKAKLLTVNPAAPIRQHAKSIQDFLPEETLAMFRSAFSHAHPLRPKAAKWVSHLDWFMGQLSVCPADKGHAALPLGCPWCSLNKRQAQSAKPQSKAPNNKATASPATPNRAKPKKPVSTPPASPATPLGSPAHLIVARVLALPLVLLGFALLALVIAMGGLFAINLANDYMRNSGLVLHIAEFLIWILYIGAITVAMGFPFYYAYINSFAREANARPGWVWPSFLLGFPTAAIVLIASAAVTPYILGVGDGIVTPTVSPIATSMAGWTGAGAIGAWVILFYGAAGLVIALRFVFLAFVGLWSSDARREFVTELGL